MKPLLSKLGLGASQFPTAVSVRGRTPEHEVREMLATAARAGLGVLDAGAAQACAEGLLGANMPRPPDFKILVRSMRGDRGPDAVEAEVRASLLRLGLQHARAVVVQSASDLFAPSGPALWDRLKRLKGEGLFDQIGVCAYASDDPAGVARRFKPDLMQAPASLLDQRLLLDGSLAAVRDMGVEVHLRSIFLNGLLFLPPDRVPAQLKGAAGRLSRARRMIAEGRSDPLQAALGFALSRPEADAVIVGASTAAELSAVIAAAASPPPDLDWDEMAIDDPVALDPRRWQAA
ncbi:MAG TPA: aldo/keto reductase [Caulobacteraceae bacterium]|jgi:aryl-alcohol dehydrogenase-like predicted oxidoreductase